MTQSVILCEGYLDRAFWAGCLEYLGCQDPGLPEGTTKRRPVIDPWGSKVAGGQFAYHSRSRRFIRIVPCGNKETVCPVGKLFLQNRCEEPLTHLILNVDADTDVSISEDTPVSLNDRAVETWLKEFGAPQRNKHGDYALQGGKSETIVSVVRWKAGDEDSPVLPSQETLERLLCAALIATYPERGPAVQHWLESRPKAPAAGPKEFGWSHMAGWYAQFGGEAFYRHLWVDKGVVTELEKRLRACGAWRVAEALAE